MVPGSDKNEKKPNKSAVQTIYQLAKPGDESMKLWGWIAVMVRSLKLNSRPLNPIAGGYEHQRRCLFDCAADGGW